MIFRYEDGQVWIRTLFATPDPEKAFALGNKYWHTGAQVKIEQRGDPPYYHVWRAIV